MVLKVYYAQIKNHLIIINVLGGFLLIPVFSLLTCQRCEYVLLCVTVCRPVNPLYSDVVCFNPVKHTVC